MKKILSLLLAVVMLSGLCSFSAFATTFATPDANGFYLNENFENGLGDFEATNSNVSLSVVPSTTAGVGGNGNVLQVTSTAADSSNTATFGADVNFANPLPVDKKMVFETRIKAPNNAGSYKYLFALYGGSRSKIYGLARLAVPGGGINYYSVNPSSGTRYDVSNPLKNADGQTYALTTTDWYRIKVVYNAGTIETIQLYSDAGVLLASGDYSDYSTQNHGYPPTQIDKIRFAQAAADTIYLDEVKIYEEVPPVEETPLAVDDSFSGMLNIGATTITIPFNKALNDTTLGNITMEGVNVANPTVTSVDVDGSNLVLTLAEGVVGSASYRVNLTGLAAQDGSTLEEDSVLLYTETVLAEGMYLNADFENGFGGFEATNSDVSLTIVPSTTAGVGGNGNVLQVTSTAADTTNVGAFGADVIFDNPIPVDKKLVFETRIKAPNNAGSYKYLFALYGGNYGKCYGLARLAIPGGGINYYYVNPSHNQRWDVSNPLKTAAGEAVTLTTTDWYRIKVIYNAGTIETIQLYSDAGVLLASGDYSNYSTQNHAYPPAQIDKIRFAQAAADTIYLDEVKIYEYTPLVVADSFTGMLNIGETTITIPFNKALDDTTLSNITIEGVNAANPTVTSVAVDGSNLVLTLAEGVIGSASYRVNLTGLTAQDGSALEEDSVLVYTESTLEEGMYLNADFENGFGGFEATNSDVSLTIVPSTTEGVGGNGNVLKVTSTAADSTNVGAFGADVNFADPIPVDKALVFETRIKAPNNAGSYKYLFALSGGGYGKCYGLARLAIPGGGINYYYVNPSHGTRWDVSNPLKTAAGANYTLNTTDWYRIKIIYNAGTIETIQLYSDAGVLLASGDYSDYSTQNHAYPPTQIDSIRFAQAAADTIYLDEVKIYEMPDPLEFMGANITSGTEVSPVETDSVVLSFSERIDSNTLNNFVVKANNVPVAYSAELVADSTQVKVTFTGGLLGGKNYTVDYSAVADINGSSVTGMVSFSTKSGLFVSNIEYTTSSIVAGATVSANVNFYNATDAAETVTVIAAVYEKVGNAYQLTAVTPMIDTTVAVGRSPIPVSVTVPANASVTNTEVKVLVLENLSTLTPLLEVASFSDN